MWDVENSKEMLNSYEQQTKTKAKVYTLWFNTG